MNWVGGAQSRIRSNSDQKKQREYFKRKREETARRQYGRLESASIPCSSRDLITFNFLRIKSKKRQGNSKPTKVIKHNLESLDRLKTRYINIPETPLKSISDNIHRNTKHDIEYDTDLDPNLDSIYGKSYNFGIPKSKKYSNTSDRFSVNHVNDTNSVNSLKNSFLHKCDSDNESLKVDFKRRNQRENFHSSENGPVNVFQRKDTLGNYSSSSITEKDHGFDLKNSQLNQHGFSNFNTPLNINDSKRGKKVFCEKSMKKSLVSHRKQTETEFEFQPCSVVKDIFTEIEGNCNTTSFLKSPVPFKDLENYPDTIDENKNFANSTNDNTRTLFNPKPYLHSGDFINSPTSSSSSSSTSPAYILQRSHVFQDLTIKHSNKSFNITKNINTTKRILKAKRIEHEISSTKKSRNPYSCESDILNRYKTTGDSTDSNVEFSYENNTNEELDDYSSFQEYISSKKRKYCSELPSHQMNTILQDSKMDSKYLSKAQYFSGTEVGNFDPKIEFRLPHKRKINDEIITTKLTREDLNEFSQLKRNCKNDITVSPMKHSEITENEMNSVSINKIDECAENSYFNNLNEMLLTKYGNDNNIGINNKIADISKDSNFDERYLNNQHINGSVDTLINQNSSLVNNQHSRHVCNKSYVNLDLKNIPIFTEVQNDSNAQESHLLKKHPYTKHECEENFKNNNFRNEQVLTKNVNETDVSQSHQFQCNNIQSNHLCDKNYINLKFLNEKILKETTDDADNYSQLCLDSDGSSKQVCSKNFTNYNVINARIFNNLKKADIPNPHSVERQDDPSNHISDKSCVNYIRNVRILKEAINEADVSVPFPVQRNYTHSNPVYDKDCLNTNFRLVKETVNEPNVSIVYTAKSCSSPHTHDFAETCIKSNDFSSGQIRKDDLSDSNVPELHLDKNNHKKYVSEYNCANFKNAHGQIYKKVENFLEVSPSLSVKNSFLKHEHNKSNIKNNESNNVVIALAMSKSHSPPSSQSEYLTMDKNANSDISNVEINKNIVNSDEKSLSVIDSSPFEDRKSVGFINKNGIGGDTISLDTLTSTKIKGHHPIYTSYTNNIHTENEGNTEAVCVPKFLPVKKYHPKKDCEQNEIFSHLKNSDVVPADLSTLSVSTSVLVTNHEQSHLSDKDSCYKKKVVLNEAENTLNVVFSRTFDNPLPVDQREVKNSNSLLNNGIENIKEVKRTAQPSYSTPNKCSTEIDENLDLKCTEIDFKDLPSIFQRGLEPINSNFNSSNQEIFNETVNSMEAISMSAKNKRYAIHNSQSKYISARKYLSPTAPNNNYGYISSKYACNLPYIKSISETEDFLLSSHTLRRNVSEKKDNTLSNSNENSKHNKNTDINLQKGNLYLQQNDGLYQDNPTPDWSKNELNDNEIKIKITEQPSNSTLKCIYMKNDRSSNFKYSEVNFKDLPPTVPNSPESTHSNSVDLSQTVLNRTVNSSEIPSTNDTKNLNSTHTCTKAHTGFPFQNNRVYSEDFNSFLRDLQPINSFPSKYICKEQDLPPTIPNTPIRPVNCDSLSVLASPENISKDDILLCGNTLHQNSSDGNDEQKYLSNPNKYSKHKNSRDVCQYKGCVSSAFARDSLPINSSPSRHICVKQDLPPTVPNTPIRSVTSNSASLSVLASPENISKDDILLCRNTLHQNSSDENDELSNPNKYSKYKNTRDAHLNPSLSKNGELHREDSKENLFRENSNKSNNKHKNKENERLPKQKMSNELHFDSSADLDLRHNYSSTVHSNITVTEKSVENDCKINSFSFENEHQNTPQITIQNDSRMHSNEASSTKAPNCNLSLKMKSPNLNLCLKSKLDLEEMNDSSTEYEVYKVKTFNSLLQNEGNITKDKPSNNIYRQVESENMQLKCYESMRALNSFSPRSNNCSLFLSKDLIPESPLLSGSVEHQNCTPESDIRPGTSEEYRDCSEVNSKRNSLNVIYCDAKTQTYIETKDFCCLANM